MVRTRRAAPGRRRREIMHLRSARVALAAACALLVAACGGGGGDSSSGGGGGRRVPGGQISTLSGGIPFVEVPKGTKAYFDKLNADGGINGVKVKFESFDDKGDPSEAAQLARKLVLQEKAVAMVGNTSLTDCDTNKAFY